MSWARKRKLIYLGSVLAIFLLFVVLPILWHFYKPPTCSDGKQNQGEPGVDCGGPCTLLCPTQYAELNILWSRFSKISDGVYNTLAYIENPNINAGAQNINYTFKLYDREGLLLAERSGQTFAPANKIMAVFEPELQTGKQIPQRIDFYFTSSAVWLKQESAEADLSILQTVMSREETAPRLSATLFNKTINVIKNIEAIAIIYNNKGNTIAFSRTVVEAIPGKESTIINFNWPQPFTLVGQAETQARTEIILKILK